MADYCHQLFAINLVKTKIRIIEWQLMLNSVIVFDTGSSAAQLGTVFGFFLGKKENTVLLLKFTNFCVL